MKTYVIPILSILALSALLLACGSSGDGNLASTRNVAFVTNTAGNGDLSTWAEVSGSGLTGLEAGDAICQTRAEAAGLSGTFVAWLSNSTDDAYCRVHGLSGKKASNCGQSELPASAGPWVRTDGTPFANTIDQLVLGQHIYTPLRFNELGVELATNEFYFTGTKMDGTFTVSETCSEWESTGGNYTGGGADYTGVFWTDVIGGPCSTTMHLACLQTGSGPALKPFVGTGKKVFLTSTQTTNGGNIGNLSGADTFCQNHADNAGLGGTFKAWISTGLVNAVDRLTSDGPWYRLDGVKVADSKADLADGKLFTSINVDENGDYAPWQGAWTGTLYTGLKSADTCDNWTSNLGTDNGKVGSPLGSSADWTQVVSTSCTPGFPLYCFED